MKKLLLIGILLLWGSILSAQLPDNIKYRSGGEDGFARSEVNFVIKIEGAGEICQYDSLRWVAIVNGAEEYHYRWWKKGEEGHILSVESCYTVPSVEYWDKGIYYCEVRDITGRKSDTATIKLEVFKTPTATIVTPHQRDTILCLNDEVILRGTASLEGTTLSWRSNKGFVSEGGNVRVKMVQAVDYIFTAANGTCETSDTVTLILNNPCVNIPSVLNTTEGSDVNITAKACDGTVIDASSLTWYRGSTNLGSHNPLLLRNARSDMYLAVKYTVGSCFVMDTLQFRTKTIVPFSGGKDDGYTGNCIPPILVEQKGVEHESCASLGDSIQLRVVAEGTDINYEWQKFNEYTYKFERVPDMPGVSIEGVNSDILYFGKVTDAASGRYRCVLQNNCSDEVISDTFILSVTGAPVIVSGLERIEREQCVSEGYADFNVVAEAGNQTGNLEYRWYKDGRQVSSEADIHERFYKVALNHTSAGGWYKVSVRNLCGEVSDSVELTVLNPPEIKKFQEKAFVCRGGDTELTIEMKEEATYLYTLYRVEITNPLTLEYEVREMAGSGSENHITLQDVKSDAVYIWEVSHSRCGSAVSGLVYVKVEDVPVITGMARDTVVCAGSSLVFDCRASVSNSFSELSYQWYKDGLAYGNPSAHGRLLFHQLKAEDAGRYECRVSNTCPAVKSTLAEIKIKDKPAYLSVKGSELPEYCEGEVVRGMEVKLSVSQKIDSVRWFWGYGSPLTDARMKGANTPRLEIDGVEAGDGQKGFYLRMYNSCGYTDSYGPEEVIHFDVREPARFVKGLDGKVDLKVCYGNTTSLCVDVTGTPEIRYSWLLNGDTVATGDVSCLPVTTTDINETQKYSCHIHNACGSEITETQVRIIRLQEFTVSGGGHYCEGEEGQTVYLSGSDSSCIYRLIREESGEVSAEQRGTGVFPDYAGITFSGIRAGTYYVVAMDRNGCEQEMQGRVRVIEDPLPAVCDFGIDRHPCGEELTGNLYLRGTETNTAYYLQRQTENGWEEMNLSYSSLNGEIRMEQIGIGNYQIRAINLLSGCQRTFGNIGLIRRPLPAPAQLNYAENDSVYCQGNQSRVELILDGDYIYGHSFQLIKDGISYGEALKTQPVQWGELEKGNYRLQVKNQWGCVTDSEIYPVYEQTLPRIYAVEGDTLYCREETGSKQIRLTGSEAGIRYSLFYGSAQEWAETVSPGGELLWEVPLEDRDFYVVAADTVYGCQIRMENTVRLRKHLLQVTPDRSPVIIHAGEDTILNISITGYRGEPRIKWEDSPYIADTDTTEDPRTKALWSSEIFRVKVEDDYCTDQAEIEIVTIGGDLWGEIRTEGCVNRKDTFRICRGEKIGLCAMAGGGGGDYTYVWSNEEREIGRGRYLQAYLPEKDEVICLTLRSYMEEVRDSVRILLENSPAIYSMKEKGRICVLPGDSVNITLERGDAGTEYELLYSTDHLNYRSVDTTGGKNGLLEFVRKDAAAHPGYYKIRARISSADGQQVCERDMEGEIEIRRQPLRFNIAGGWEYCAGSRPEGMILIDSSEIGISYHLCGKERGEVGTLTGNGDTLKFRGEMSADVYEVIAVAENCRDTMEGEAVVKEYALPAPGELRGAGNYCLTDAPVKIRIVNGEPDKMYQVVANRISGERDTFNYYGTGILEIGELNAAGHYRVSATDTLTGCSVSVGEVTIGESPGEVKVAGEGVVCNGATVASVNIRLYPYEEGVSYTLYRLPDMAVGRFGNAVADTLFYTGNLALGDYVVRAQIGNCSRQYTDTVKVVRGNEMSLPDLAGNLRGCEGESLEMGLVSSQPGFLYVLRDPAGNEIKKYGDGAPVRFGAFHVPGVYTITLKNSDEGCERRHDSVYRIEAMPEKFRVSGSGEYCEADSTGRTIGLSGSESSTVYFLQSAHADGWTDVSYKTGTGTAFEFGGIYSEGTYRVVAGSVCRRVMEDSVYVSAVRYPDAAVYVEKEGGSCAGEEVTLSLVSSLSGYTYEIYRGTHPVEGSRKEGNGSGLSWRFDSVQEGVYRVFTREGECRVALSDSVEINRVPVLGNLTGDSVICAGGSGELAIMPVSKEVTYFLRSLPEDMLYATGIEEENRVTFTVRDEGEYYVKAIQGMCEVSGKTFRVHEMNEIEVPEWETNDCIKRGEGEVVLKNTEAGKIYTLTGASRVYRVDGYAGDTLLKGLDAGIYTLVVEDAFYGCKSKELRDTIREGVYTDTVMPPLTYCETDGGVQPVLSGVRIGVKYSLWSLDRVLLSQIERPDKSFPLLLTAGEYIFRKEREIGSCVKEDTIRIVEDRMPQRDLEVTLTGESPVCEGRTYRINLLPEEGVSYYLYHTGRNLFLDTLQAEGGETGLQFKRPVSMAGRYRIYARSGMGKCMTALDTMLIINGLPEIPEYTLCHYCYEGQDTSAGCSVTLSGMKETVHYRLENEAVKDTLSGIGIGHFAFHPAGDYHLIAESRQNGCKDTVAVSVKGVLKPIVYAVEAGCDTLESAGNVLQLPETEGDSVVYRLYKDGVYVNREQQGTGLPLVFDELKEPGVYRVKAQKRGSDCEVFMEDSMILYRPLQLCGDTMIVTGSFCEHMASGGVTLTYPCSVPGWTYYVTNGVYNSIHIAGGRSLSWNAIGGSPIREGEFELYAVSPCGHTRRVAKAVVRGLPAPEAYPLENTDLSYCTGSSFELVLSSSEPDARYRVKRYNSSYVLQEESDWVDGRYFSRVILGQFAAAGYYEVVALKDNGCRAVIQTLDVPLGRLPKEQSVTGSDICVSAGETGAITVGIPEREDGVAYYLYLNGERLVDSLTSVYKPGDTDFDSQQALGCYTVVARIENGGCAWQMHGSVCMSTAARPQGFVNTADTSEMCMGNRECIALEAHEAGIRYVLIRDYATEVASVTGSPGGGVLELGCVEEEGLYTVEGVVGNCRTPMKDSVYIRLREVPELNVDPQYRFCEHSEGVKIRVNAPTSSRLQYFLTTLSNVDWEDACRGDESGGSVEFERPVREAGAYTVSVEDEYCMASKTVEVTMEKAPDALQLVSSAGNYLCEGSALVLKIEEEPGNDVVYELYRMGVPDYLSVYNFRDDAFRSIKEPGTYYVVARSDTGMYCETRFGALEIHKADTLRHFRIESVKRVYCETDTAKGSLRLSGSETGVEYELVRDGVPTGIKQLGTGRALMWYGVEGRRCGGTAQEWDGAVYRVMARDTLTGCTEPMWGMDTVVEASYSTIAGKNLPDLSVCEGSPAELSVTATGCANTYTWYHWGTVVKSGREPYYNIDTVKTGDEGAYYCEVQNVCGLVATSNTALVEIRKAVTLRKPMEDKRICDGSSAVVLSASFENARKYFWYRPGQPESVLKESQYFPLNLSQQGVEGKYICRAESGDGCGSLTDTVEVFIGQAAVVNVTEKADTFCRNSFYATPVITVTHADSLRWFHNGKALGYTGDGYSIPALQPEHAGIYTVMAYSYKCGDVIRKVSDLYVDDTVRLLGETHVLLTGCPGRSQYLTPELENEVRVNYRWEKAGVTLGHESKYPVGPFVENSRETYRVWCRNRCNVVYRDYVVQVPKRIGYEDPVRSILLCADGVTDTTIRVNVEPESLAKVKWYFHRYGDTAQIYTGVEGESFTLKNTVVNGGYYQSVAYNACQERVPLPDTWVRIDSVPVLLSNLTDDTLCIGGETTVTLAAAGGGMNYRWYLQRKDGRIDSTDMLRLEYVSEAGFLLEKIDESYDSCRIWCCLSNNCGEIGSDTMRIRVNRPLYPEISGDTFSVCEGEIQEVIITLNHGIQPWGYSYRNDPATEVIRNGLTAVADTLRLTEGGLYQILQVWDAEGSCQGRPEALPEFYINVKEKSSLHFSGGGEACFGDTVSLSLQVTGGTGPYEITLTDGEQEALNICDHFPLVMYQRDTVLKFLAEDSAVYHVSRSVYDAGNECWGHPVEETVKVKVHIPEHVEFVPGPWNVGQCRSVNLDAYLQPRVRGEKTDKGRFYVDGQILGTDHLWLQRHLKGDSCYRVYYGYMDDYGCAVSSDEVLVCVDSLPSGAVASSDVACESVVNYFELQLRPAGRIDSVVIRQARYKKWDSIVNPVVRPSYRTISYSKTQIPSDGLVQVPLNWDEVGGVDSCMTFEVLDIFDSHGCRMNHGISVREYDSLYRDTVWRHWDPVVDVEVRRSENKPWDRGVHEVNLPQGDSVQVRVTLVKGMPLWSLPTLGVDSIATMDTVFWLKQEGIYYFQPKDLSCGRQSTTPPYDLTITHLDTGYFRGRLLLEGPYDEENGNMSQGNCNSTRLNNSLRLPSYLPLLPSHLSVIDWVEVELRVGSNIDSVALMTDSSFLLTRDTCLLLSDGHLADRLTGDTIVGIRNAYGSGSNRRYVAVRHRNHLGVMTARTYPFVKKTNKRAAAFIDFTKSSAIYLSGVSGNDLNHHMTYKSGGDSGVWLLSAGELNTNFLITLHDPNEVTEWDIDPSSGFGYRYDLLHDINLDGCVDWPGWNGTAQTDWLFVQRNRQKFTEIRWR